MCQRLHLLRLIMPSSSRWSLVVVARTKHTLTLVMCIHMAVSTRNAWSLEMVLKQGSSVGKYYAALVYTMSCLTNNRGWLVGSALTFSQMSFIAVQALPSFITFRTEARGWNWIPRLTSRAIPLSTWLVQVLLFVFMSLLNNWAFAYRVPLTVQIVIRSSGKPFLSCRSVCCVCYLVIQI